MNRWPVRLFLIAVALLSLPISSPAPLIYREGEGWVYEKVGGDTKWMRTRAKDQLQVAQEAFDKKSYGLAMRAARRTVAQWEFSDYAPQAQYLMGRCEEARGHDQVAFKSYQKLIEKYPKIENYQEIVDRQFAIANRFMGGQWFRLWSYIPIPPSMDKTVDMYETVIKNGPYSEVATKAQLNVGAVREKQADFPLAIKAYERAADRYADREKVASEAMFKAGVAYTKQAKTAEYDQNVASQAIATFTDFSTLHPDDARVAEAQKKIEVLRAEQARGSFEIAKFYEKGGKLNGALIYYNEVIVKDANSKYAAEARQRIDEIKKRMEKK